MNNISDNSIFLKQQMVLAEEGKRKSMEYCRIFVLDAYHSNLT